MSALFGAPLAEIDREPLCMAVARRIRTAIVSGELPRGTPLPSEKTLSTQLGVGRSTIREALRILQSQGLLTGGNSVSTRGPTVDGSGSVFSAASALENVMLLGEVSLEDLVALRLLIEEAALVATATARDPDALAQAAAALEEMRDAKNDIERFHRADVAFHAALIAASNNRAYALVMNVLRDTTAAHLREALHDEPRPGRVLEQLIDEHEQILEAIRAGHGKKAARMVGKHIRDFYARHMEP